MILYHGTKSGLLDSIKKHGLGGVRLYGYCYTKPLRVYLTTDINLAWQFATMSPTSTSSPVILEIDTDTLDISKLRDDGNTIFTYPGVINIFKVLDSRRR